MPLFNDWGNPHMTELEAIRARHSVRQYLNKPLKPDELAALRAAGERITATPRGYVLERPRQGVVRAVACLHRPEDMERELTLMVDQGCTVEDVIIEHPVYGQLTGPLALSSRYDISEFIRKVEKNDARPLSALTDGVHLHTLRCPSQEALDRTLAALDEAGFLAK